METLTIDTYVAKYGAFLVEHAVTIGALHCCPHGQGITYKATLEAVGGPAVVAALRTGDRAGMLCWRTGRHDHAASGRAILDILDDTGIYSDRDLLDYDLDDYVTGGILDRDLLNYDSCISDSLCIPSTEAWQWWSTAVELRAISSRCPTCLV